MSTLPNEQFDASRPRLDEAGVTALLGDLPDWTLGAHNGLQALVREFRFKNFYHVMSFVNAVAWIANKEGHHPDMEIGYGRVRIAYSTHDAGGLTRNDFIVCAKIDALLHVGQFGPVLA